MEGKSLEVVYQKLRDIMEYGRYYQAQSLVSGDLTKAIDEFGTLMHYAAWHNNVKMTEYLLKLGSDVDSKGQADKTPLMIAVKKCHHAIVATLLKAGANIDIVNNSNKNALQMVFKTNSTSLFHQFIRKVQADFSVEKSAKKLIDAGCKIYHAINVTDIEMLDCMVKLGADVNCTTDNGDTPLIVASYLISIDMVVVKWLIKNGANVNVTNRNGCRPLYFSVKYGRRNLVEYLLNHGANPNAGFPNENFAPLRIAAANLASSDRQYAYVDCFEILIDYDGIPPNVSWKDFYKILELAFKGRTRRIIPLLMARLALLEKLGSSIAKPVMHCLKEKYLEAFDKAQKNYEQCQLLLGTTVLVNLTLFDLLSVSDYKLRLYARYENFLSKIEKFCSEYELSKLYPYYFKKLMKRIPEATEMVKLEDKGILAICRLFEADYNQCYYFAKQIVRCLNRRDLEQLALV